GPIMALHEGNLVVLDLIADLTPHAAIGAHRVDFSIDLPAPMLGDRIDDGFRHQGPRWARLDALPASDASREPHGIVEIKDRLRADIAESHTNHIVDLNLSTGANAEPAVDAGVEVDRHCRMGKVRARNAM